ncbi:MAG TPA: TatD family hydrolase [Planctomycetota bacterium]|nr:TatD family hydrolase [Planctomycetota bacterium]
MKIVDSHAHLYFEHFKADRAEVLAAARAAGVAAFVNVGTDAETTRLTFELAAAEPDVFPTAGIHPNDAHVVDADEWAVVERYARDPRCVAIGETGLDWFRNRDQREAQIAAFERQIGWARELGLPVIIHCREAFDDVFATFERVGRGVPGVMHCFSGGPAEAERAVGLGLHVSFAAPITYRKNDALREAAKRVPRERVLTETDCPFLPPESRRGKGNEPAYLAETVAALARALDLRPDEVATLAARNAVALFRLPVAI